MRFLVHFLVLIATGFLMLGCEDKAAARRIDLLEAELRDLKANTNDKVDAAVSRTDNIIQKVEAAEKSSKDAIDQTGTLLTGIQPRIERLENQITENRRLIDSKEQLAHLRPNSPGSVPLVTQVGSLLLSLEGMVPSPTGTGFLAEVNIGNPFSLEINSFDLKGDFGTSFPRPGPGQQMSEYRNKLDAWQKTMIPYEVTIQKKLRPNSWTKINIPLATANKDAIELIRVGMNPRSVKLINTDTSVAGATEIDVSSKAGSIFKTDYGGMLVTVVRVEPEGGSSRVHLRIGNPFGLTINEFVLKGDYGASKPKLLTGENPEMYARRLMSWSNALKPFTATVSANLSPFRWASASFTVPTSDLSQVLYFRCSMKPTAVSLPNPVQ